MESRKTGRIPNQADRKRRRSVSDQLHNSDSMTADQGRPSIPASRRVRHSGKKTRQRPRPERAYRDPSAHGRILERKGEFHPSFLDTIVYIGVCD